MVFRIGGTKVTEPGGLAVQLGQTQRSYARYLDVFLPDSSRLVYNLPHQLDGELAASEDEFRSTKDDSIRGIQRSAVNHLALITSYRAGVIRHHDAQTAGRLFTHLLMSARD